MDAVIEKVGCFGAFI